MAVGLSKAVAQKVSEVFAVEQRAEVTAALINQCGRNLPFYENADARQLEQVRLAVLHLSHGNRDRLRRFITMAQSDWRDVLMAAEYGEDWFENESLMAELSNLPEKETPAWRKAFWRA